MRSIMDGVKYLAIAAASIALTAGSAGAKELKMATGFAPGSHIYFSADDFKQQIERMTNGEITVKIYPLNLLSVPQMLNGVRDGVVDVGIIMPPVFVSQFPEGNLVADLAMLGESGPAMAGAATEYFMTCDDCQDEYTNNNLVYLGSGAGSPYDVLATKPFVTADDFKGAKLRAANATFNRWVEHLGGVAVTLPGNEIFEAVKQGTVDGAVNGTQELLNLRLIDVVSHVTTGVPGGTYHVVDVTKFNRDTWKSLSEDQRRKALEAAAHSVASLVTFSDGRSIEAVEQSKAMGIIVTEASDELKAITKEFVENDQEVIAQVATERGVPDAKEKIARFAALVDKWNKLTEGVGTDTEKLFQIYMDEIYSKVDAATYGI